MLRRAIAEIRAWFVGWGEILRWIWEFDGADLERELEN